MSQTESKVGKPKGMFANLEYNPWQSKFKVYDVSTGKWVWRSAVDIREGMAVGSIALEPPAHVEAAAQKSEIVEADASRELDPTTSAPVRRKPGRPRKQV